MKSQQSPSYWPESLGGRTYVLPPKGIAPKEHEPPTENEMKKIETITTDLIERSGGQTSFLNMVGASIFEAIDFTLNGEAMCDLEACEKTYMGTRAAKVLMKKLNLKRAKPLDTIIADIPIDIKFTIHSTWMIPPICQNNYCMLLQANYSNRTFSVGFSYVKPENLSRSENWDRKRALRAGSKHIFWIAKNRHYVIDYDHPITFHKNEDDLIVFGNGS